MSIPFRARSIVPLAILIAVLAALPFTAHAEKALGNDDVIKLSKLGLGEETIIAKIRQAAQVDFNLETDDLVKLKNAGVTGNVISAMLARGSSGGAPNGIPDPTGGRKIEASERTSPVRLVTAKETVGLTSLVGSPSSTYVYVTVLFWLNYPGQHATHMTSDRSPSFFIASEQTPRSRYYIVRLDVNTKDDDRSVKIGKSGAFSFRAGTTPDSDWTSQYEAIEDQKGVWKLTLKKPLAPGEYGVFVVGNGELYDFAVE